MGWHRPIWRGDWDIVCPNHEKFPEGNRCARRGPRTAGKTATPRSAHELALFFPCILIRVNGSLTAGEAGLRLWVPWKLKFRSCGNQTNQRSVEVDTDLEGQKEGKAEALQIASRAFS
jgi:hypothetical protein